MEDRLQKFTQLVDSGSFTRAAQLLHISQPALTIAINKLERELQTPLLVRSHRKLTITPAGETAYEAAKQHQIVNGNLYTRLSELAHQRPKVVIGMVDSVAAALCTTTEPLRQLELTADVSIIVNNSRYLREAVRTGEVDVAFVVAISTSDIANSPTNSQKIGDEPFAIVCHPDRLEATRTGIKSGISCDFISYDQSSDTRRIIDGALQQSAIAVRPVFYSTSPDVILRMVLLGRGIAALPYLAVQPFLLSGALVTFPINFAINNRTSIIGRPVHLLASPDKKLPETLNIFLVGAKQALAEAWKPYS